MNECAYCEEPFDTEPVRDLDEVAWRGIEQAKTWCSAECRDNYSERASAS